MPSTFKKIAALSGVVAICAVAYGANVWCSYIGACVFGAYEAELVVRNLTTEEYMAEAYIEASLANGDLIFANPGQPFLTRTDSKGAANITFGNAFSAPLSIHVLPVDKRTRSVFFVPHSSISRNTTITLDDSERYLSRGGERDTIEIQLHVGDWYFWRAIFRYWFRPM